MLEERLHDTKRFLERLAIETGKSREDILKYLTQAYYNETDRDPTSDIEANDGLGTKYGINQNTKSKKLQNKRSLLLDPTTGVESIQSSQQSSDSQKTVGTGSLLQKTAQIIESSILQLQKISTIIMENVVEQMVTKKIYKIRQNFRDLILGLLGINQFTFYAFYESGRVQYQEFSSNFITQIMESDANYSALQKIIGSATSQYNFIDLASCTELMKLFQVSPSEVKSKNYYGLVSNQGSCQEENNFSFCLMIKSDCKNISNINEELVPKLISKIIEISQINTTQDSIYATSKNYMKKMLDLLEILLIQCEIRLKRALIHQCKINKELYYSITNIIKILLSKIDEHFANEQIIHNVRKLAGQFEEAQYKKIEETRMYKKYLRENNITMLQFNRVGVLQFISGNKDNFYLNELTRIWEEGKPVLDQLFRNNEKFDSYVKKAIRGSLKSERPLEIANYVKAKIATNGKRIQKIQIIIQDPQGSTPDSNIQIPPPLIQKENNIMKENRNESSIRMRTLKQIQREYPGLSKEGWLDLFLKGKPQKTPRNKSSSMSKKSNTMTISKAQTDAFATNRIRQLSCVLPKQKYKVGLEDIVIDNPNLNFLTFSDQQLEYFAIKVLNSLDYFQRLPQEKAKLQNFISQLHDNYEVHSNPFHNFKHGINVMHACYLLSSMPANLNIFDVKDIFANVFSGLCHDVGHTGFTNAFQIASMSRKALTYNDKSPLENFHASLTFQILRKPENNFLCHMQREQFIKFRKSVIDNILFTDIKEHFPMLNNFNDLLKSGKILGKEDAPLLSAMIVHASDFAGSVKQFQICKAWSLRVNQQFSNQYKVQGQIGIPQTPFMKDLGNTLVLSKAEGGFLKVIVYPLYQALDKFYITEGIAHKFKKNIQQNIKAWQQLNRIQNEKVKALQKEQEKQ